MERKSNSSNYFQYPDLCFMRIGMYLNSGFTKVNQGKGKNGTRTVFNIVQCSCSSIDTKHQQKSQECERLARFMKIVSHKMISNTTKLLGAVCVCECQHFNTMAIMRNIENFVVVPSDQSYFVRHE